MHFVFKRETADEMDDVEYEAKLSHLVHILVSCYNVSRVNSLSIILARVGMNHSFETRSSSGMISPSYFVVRMCG